MITINQLSVTLGGTRVIDALDLKLARGRVSVVLGPNGAGKTSLIHALAGLLPASSGTIDIDGVPLTQLSAPARARKIGYLPQSGEPVWDVRAHELVALGRLPHQSRLAAASPADAHAITQAMAQTNTLGFAGRRIASLSGGERARVKLARVLAGSPEWILADEPLANLDPVHQRDTLRLFSAAAARGCGVVLVLHQLDAAARIADDLVLLKAGRLIEAGPRDAVLTRAALHATFDMDFRLVTDHGQIAILGES